MIRLMISKQTLLLTMVSLLLSACATSIPSEYSDLSKAKILYDQNADKPEYAGYYARSLLHNNDPKNALNIITKAYPDKIENVQVAILFADIYAKLDDKKNAENLYKKAIDLAPDNLETIKSITAFYSQNKQFPQTLQYWDRVIYPPYSDSLDKEEFLELANNALLDLIALDLYIDAQSLINYMKHHFPHDLDVERNLRIVRAMVQTHGHSAPKPTIKTIATK